ncbi:MAG TPA: biotin/lipoyl-containing protein, partial [Candidatus Deferrimicrobium sp.]
MPFELKLPDVGEGIAEGEVVRWLVAEGAAVKEDDLLVEILTDKANIELPSPVSGTFLKILAQAGQIVKVGEPIALIEPAAGQAAAHHLTESPGPPTSTLREAKEPGEGSPSGNAGGEVLATPVVRKLAKDLGVELGAVPGSGPGGRV